MFSLCWWQVFLEGGNSLSERSFLQLLLQVMQGFDFSQMQAGVALFFVQLMVEAV